MTTLPYEIRVGETIAWMRLASHCLRWRNHNLYFLLFLVRISVKWPLSRQGTRQQRQRAQTC